MEQLTKQDVLAIHKETSVAGKKLLEQKYAEFFPTAETYMDQWKSFQEQYKKQDLVLPYPKAQNDDEMYLNAQFMMMHIFRAKRLKKPDYSNSSESKYESAWNLQKAATSGFAFAGAGYGLWGTDTSAGSRLCIPNDLQLLKDIQREYVMIWEKILTEP